MTFTRCVVPPYADFACAYIRPTLVIDKKLVTAIWLNPIVFLFLQAPGTGKTFLSSAIAGELKSATCFSLSYYEIKNERSVMHACTTINNTFLFNCIQIYSLYSFFFFFYSNIKVLWRTIFCLFPPPIKYTYDIPILGLIYIYWIRDPLHHFKDKKWVIY